MSNERILIVDDSATAREFARMILTSCGFNVILASGVSDAIGILARDDWFFKGILTDHNMPEGGGIALCCYVKEKTPEMPVILMSGSEFESGHKVHSMGFSAIVSKDFFNERKAFTNKIRKILSGR